MRTIRTRDFHLVLWPLEKVLLVVEYIAGIVTGEPPVDEGSPTVDLTIPGARFGGQSGEIRNTPIAEALTGEQSDFDFGLIKPTTVLWSVMDREAIPQLRPFFQTEVSGQRFPAVNIEVVDDEVNGASQRILMGQHRHDAGERRAGASRCWHGKVSACAWLNRTEYVGRTFALVFAIAFGDYTWASRLWRPDFTMKRNRLLVQADYRLVCVMRALVQLQHVFHASQIRVVDLRQAPHFFPATA